MYSGRVLVGFWFDKLQLESEQRAKQAERRARGELPRQRRFRLVRAFRRAAPLLRPVSTGRVEYRQPVLLHGPEILDISRFLGRKTGCPDELVDEGERRYGLVLAATSSALDLAAGVRGIGDGCALACVADKAPQARSVFAFVPARAGPGDVVAFGQELFLRLAHASEQLYLRSEPPLLDGRFGPNYHNPVRLSLLDDCYAKWRVLCWDRQRRFESEGLPVAPCIRIVIQHVMTNQCLAVEHRNWHRSLLGFECGVSVHTYSDVHRNETSECIWNIIAKGENDEDDCQRAAAASS